MPSKNVDAVFGLKDHFSAKMTKIIASMEKGKKEMNRLSWDIQKHGRKIKAAGDMMTAAFTLPIAAAGAFSINAAKEVKEGTDKIVAATGATGDKLKEFTDDMKAVAGTVASDFASIGGTLGEVNTRFEFTGERLRQATEDFEKFAKVTGQDGVTSVQLVSRAIENAGIPADQYRKVLDQLTVAGQASGVGVDQLAENLTKYGATLRGIGLDTEASIAMFASFEKSGVNTEAAFAGMKKAVGNWSKEGKDAAAEFQKTIDVIASAPDITSAASIAVETFGNKAGRELADSIRSGKFEYEDMLDLIQGSDGAFEQAYTDMMGPAEKMQIALNKLKGPASELGGVIIDTVMPVFDRLSGHLDTAAKWFESLSDGQKKALVYLGLTVAAVGPLTSIVGKLTISFGKNINMFAGFIKAMKTGGAEATGLAKIFGSLSTAFSGGFSGIFTAARGGFTKLIGLFGAIPLPILAVAAVIGVLVAAFKHLWDTNEDFRKSITATWNRIKDTVGKFVAAIRMRIEKSGLAEKFGEITGKIKVLWDAFCGFLAPVFSGGFTVVANLLETGLGVLLGLFDVFASIFTGNWRGAWNGVKKIFSAVWKGFRSTVTAFLGWLKKSYPAAYNVIRTVGDKIKNDINRLKTIFNGIITFVKGVFTGNWRKAWEGVKQVFSSVFSGFANLFKIPMNGVITILNKAIEKFNSLANGISDKASAAGFSGVATAAKKVIINKIKPLATGTENWAGGLAQVSEKGGEIIDLPRGSRVYPHDESVAMARREGSTVVNVNIGSLAESVIVREEADIEKIAAKFAAELKKVLANRGGEVVFP